MRILPEGGHDFLAALIAGAPLGEAAAALADPGAHLVGLFEAGAATAIR